MESSNLQRIKVLRGYTENARFGSLLTDEPVGEIKAQCDISSPFSFSQEWPVFALAVAWNGYAAGTLVVIRETRHARYEVFEVPEAMVSHA